MLRSRIPVLAACGALTAGVVACGTILGIQDRSLDTAGGDAGVEAAVESSVPMESGAEAAMDAADADVGATDAADASDTGVPPCNAPCPLATGLDLPLRISSDSSNIYWTEWGDSIGATNGFVKGCPLSGCMGGPHVYAMAQLNPIDAQSDEQNVFWVTSAPANAGGAVWSCPVAGCGAGGPKMLVQADSAQALALDSTYVYWVGWVDGTVHRVAKTGGSDDLLWDASTGGFNRMTDCVVDDASVYVIDEWTDILRIPTGGGAAFTINSVTSNPPLGNWLLGMDPASLYYGTFDNGTLVGSLMRASKTTAGAGSMFTTNLQQPWGVTVDPASGDVYYADVGSGTGAGNDGVVGKVPAGGGPAVPLYSGLIDPIALTVRGSQVYWVMGGMWDAQGDTIPGTGAIYRGPK